MDVDGLLINEKMENGRGRDEDYDSDATTLGHASPDSDKTPPLFITEPLMEPHASTISTSSSTSVETMYEIDPNYPSVPQTQLCYKKRHTLHISRVKEKLTKKGKLNFDCVNQIKYAFGLILSYPHVFLLPNSIY